MAAMEFNWQPSDRQVRQFGVTAAIVVPLVGWLLAGSPGWKSDWSAGHAWLIGALSVAGALAGLVGWLAPPALKPVYLGLMLLSFPIGLVLSELILLAIYAGVFVPIGIVFRLIGRDVLQRRLDRGKTSYWEPKTPPQGPASYYRQS